MNKSIPASLPLDLFPNGSKGYLVDNSYADFPLDLCATHNAYSFSIKRSLRQKVGFSSGKFRIERTIDSNC